MPALVDFQTLPELFTGLSTHYHGQNRPALGYKSKQTKQWEDITWEELTAQVEAMAGYLYHHGIRPGDRVGILSENRPEWMVIELGLQKLGAVNVSLYTTLPPSQVAYILQDSGAAIFFVSTGIQLRKAEEVFADCSDLHTIVTMSEMRKEHPDYVHAWDAIMAEGAAHYLENAAEINAITAGIKSSDLATLIYTSGTTGNPKGVMLTHENLCTNALGALKVVPFSEVDSHLSFLPLCHSFERTAGYVAAMSTGAKIYYAESIDTVSRNLLEVHPTIMISVPRLFERVYNLIVKSVEEGPALKKRIFHWSVAAGMKAAEVKMAGQEPSGLVKWQAGMAHKLVFSKLHEKLGGNLRFAVSGGAALPKAIGDFFMAAGITIMEGYGLTETAPVLSVNPLARPRFGTVGHVMHGVTVGIQDINTGEILGQLTGADYPNTLSTAEGEIVAKGPNIMQGYWNNPDATAEVLLDDGWFHTGDVGRFEEGYLRITDRIKHMIVSKGGKNIYPGPIEEQFVTNPLVDQLMIVGEAREYLTALVVPSFDTLRTLAKEQNLAATSEADLLKEEAVQTAFKQMFRQYSKGAAAHEKVRDFRLIVDPFTVENSLMTPTLKPRRKAISTHYADLIEAMYAAVV